MKKMITLALALVFAFGLASAAFAMGPDADSTTVGFVLTNFVMSDQMLTPLAMPNWSGSLNSNQTIAEGQPVWFIAHFVQNPNIVGDGRNFIDGSTRKTVFSSKDNVVNFMYSTAYMNFVWIDRLEVIGGQISGYNQVRTGAVSSDEYKLEVTVAAIATQPSNRPTTSQVQALTVPELPAGSNAAHYYLQIMGFTKACNESQGVVLARTPIDMAEFTAVTDAANFTAARLTTIPTTSGSVLNVYDDYGYIRYKVVRFQITSVAPGTVGANLANLGAAVNDYLYGVYDSDDDPLVGFVSNNSTYKGITVASGTALDAGLPVQWSSDDGGKWVFTNGTGIKAISDSDLKTIMAFFGFTFGNNYPVLARHFEARAGYWRSLEARYNVASAVILTPDLPIEPVPKTGDTASSMGLIMIALALSALAAVGFVVTKRVRS